MVYIHLAEGFEEVEALTIVDILRRAQIDAKTVSMTGENIVSGCHDISVKADILFEEADYAECEMIVLPGGLPGATNLEAHQGLCRQIKTFASEGATAGAGSGESAGGISGKKLAAICAAPLVFGTCGILEGVPATIYPGMEEHLKGGIPTGEHVTVSGNIITGMGPALAMEFALTLVRELKGTECEKEIASGLLFK